MALKYWWLCSHGDGNCLLIATDMIEAFGLCTGASSANVIKSCYEAPLMAQKVLRTSKSEMQLKVCAPLHRILFYSSENSMESAKAFQTRTQSRIDGWNFCTRLHRFATCPKFKVSTRESMIENKVLPRKLSRFVCNLRRVLPVVSSQSFPLWKTEQTKRGILLWENFHSTTRVCVELFTRQLSITGLCFDELLIAIQQHPPTSVSNTSTTGCRVSRRDYMKWNRL